jgi:hypothetical protein
MGERQRAQLNSIKEQEKADKFIAEKFASALASVKATPDNLQKLIERCASQWLTSPELTHLDRRAHKVRGWIAAGLLLGREISTVGAVNFFSELVGDELTMSETSFLKLWNMPSAAKLKQSRINRGLIPADARETVSEPCKSGKKCLNLANRKPADAKGTSHYCSKNCAASDRARKKRLQNVGDIPKVTSIDSETRLSLFPELLHEVDASCCGFALSSA